ncbi:O-succinylbenzoic acid--CoA ligase [Maribacter vaceletii]|uniref:O-succinylbenzoic acid--CoA ligase n=1 Tax=Maribacter vaceletii TaxID=1206816 RepID=A0A495E7L9_9FLAO|nr:AMP-binding protein [Maribacter vaceletii]RKR12930.1 O-succinylbenzoic acid--CoA ligase [Maribacter vaceletii]
MDWSKIHSDFKLNGVSISKKEIPEVAYSYIKEGEDFEKEIGEFLQNWIDNKETIEVKTSGSTGVPKLLVLKKEHMVNSAIATGKYFNLEPKNTALLCMSANYIAGKMMLVRAMVLGLHITVIAPSSNPLEKAKKQFDFCAMVPLQLQNSLGKLNALRTVIIGGAPMSISLKEKVQGLKTAVFETYGMTETITHIALKKINNNPKKTFSVLPNVKVSKDGRDCLVIDAPKITNTTIVTNDIVEIISETEFNWLGRVDNVINSGGVKLHPEQIEAKLSSIVKNTFFVAGIFDEILGEKLVLVLENENENSLILEKIKEIKTITKYQIPKSVYIKENFIYTPNGKLNRKATLNSLNL